MDAIEQKTSEKKEKGYAPTVIRYTVYVNINTHTYIYICIYIFLCVCMFLRSSYAYLYNSRPLKLDPPSSDSHRRTSSPARCTSSWGSGAWRGEYTGRLAAAWRTCGGTMPPGHGPEGWLAWWASYARACKGRQWTWKAQWTKTLTRPGSAAGAREDHQPHQ